LSKGALDPDNKGASGKSLKKQEKMPIKGARASSSYRGPDAIAMLS